LHTLVRRYLKTAIAFLGVGLILGGWMMVLGVALWLFPRPEKGDARYSPRIAGAAYWLITLGTASRIAGELLHLITSGDWLSWFVVSAGMAQILGIGAFFYTMWSRIRPLGSQVREAKGERF
jgi:hypothetical protein